MIQMMVFDMAGTTVDEANVVYRTLHQVMQDAGYQLSLDDVMREGAGKEKLDAIKGLMSLAPLEGTGPTAVEMHKQFLSRLTQAYRDLEVVPFSGVEATFGILMQASVKVVLNTGYDRTTAESLLQKLGWKEGESIDLLVTADDVERSRPHPDMIHLAMEKLGIDRAEAVAKIGDSMVDIEEGKAAGCGKTFGITTGAQTRQQLEQASPTAILDQMRELLPMLGVSAVSG